MAIKDAQDALSRASERGRALSGKLEDLVFRAQRIARAIKNGTQVPDSMFGRDLKEFRLDIRSYGTELSGLPNVLTGVAQSARLDPGAKAPAQAISQLSQQIHENLLALEDQGQLASQHIRGAEYKSEMGYLYAEIHGLLVRAQDLPSIADQIVLQAKAAAPAPVAAPAPAAAGSPPRPRAVPLRALGRLSPASLPVQPDSPAGGPPPAAPPSPFSA
ncbi:MAG: hypothetical protein PHU21_06685 [Elusimicrobia bacterium]|nr:hypothetical protein [Elusimicrobiota bacterium]